MVSAYELVADMVLPFGLTCQKYEFLSVCAFKDYLYIGMVEDSSKFFTEPRSRKDRN